MADERFAGLPELAASLRTLGSSRRSRHGAAVQPRFFAFLLNARKEAARANTRADAVAAFDGSTLLHSLDSIIRDLATERFPSKAPARRAFEAELTEAVEPLRLALTRLRDLGPAAAADTPDMSAWEKWVAQLRVVFASADAAWPAVDAALEVAAPQGEVRFRQ